MFADDSWSSITQRQQMAEQRALSIYEDKYQFNNINGSIRNWNGLTSVTTDEDSRGRDIPAQQQVSLENALAAFDMIHIRQLADLQSNYTGLTSTTTDENGRNRNDMIAQGMNSTDQILGQLMALQTSSTYDNFAQGDTTDESTIDRQAQIEAKWSAAESQAAGLVSSLAKINGVYVNLSGYSANIPQFVYHEGSVTNENTLGRQLEPAQMYALEKGVFIFEQIHQKHLEELQSNYYGLNSVTTDENGRSRNAMLEQAQQVSLENAMRVYNSYYNGVGLK